MAKTTAKRPTPGGIFQTSAEERYTQLLTIADALLHQIHYGQLTASERSRLIKQYDEVDRILQRHKTGSEAAPDFTALNEAFEAMEAEDL